jgi:hypothetical protein
MGLLNSLFHEYDQMKSCLSGQGGVANPRDTFGHRRGFRLALARNASISLVAVFMKQGTW